MQNQTSKTILAAGSRSKTQLNNQGILVLLQLLKGFPKFRVQNYY